MKLPQLPFNLPSKLAIPKVSERTQLIIVASVAILCGLTATVSTIRFIKGAERALAKEAHHPQTASVVVARQDVDSGAILDRSMAEVVEWPKAKLPSGSVAEVDKVVGRHVKTKIFRGEPLLEARLVPEGERGGLQVRIPEGMLAMSLKVDPEIGVSGFISPGSRVDVVVTLRLARAAEPVTKVVLQRLLVLAVEHEVEYENDKPKDATTVTLAVTPEESEKLALARTEGKIMLALRNLHDSRQHDTPGFSAAELTATTASIGAPSAEPPAEQAAAPPEPAPESYHVVQLLEGENSREVKFKLR